MSVVTADAAATGSVDGVAPIQSLLLPLLRLLTMLSLLRERR